MMPPRPMEKKNDLMNAPSLFKIIYVQKMTFEQARLESNYDVMRSSLQNILDNLVNKAKKESKSKQILEIEKALRWFDNLEYDRQYIRRLENGSSIHVFPVNIQLKVNYALKFAYTSLNKLIEELNII